MTYAVHQDLMSKVNVVIIERKNKIAHEFVVLLGQKRYQEALALGAQNCDPKNKVLTELLSILMRYENSLSLDLTLKAGSESLAYHALNNNNFTVYFLLSKNYVTDEKTDKLYEQKYRAAFIKINIHTQKDYQEKLSFIIKKMKSDILTNSDDLTKVRFIISVIEFNIKYHSNLMSSDFVDCQLTSFEKELLNAVVIAQVRDHIIFICSAIHHLSPSFRAKYEESLQQLNWISFNKLMGSIKPSEQGAVFLIPTTIDPEHSETSDVLCQRLREEFSSLTQLSEYAISTMVNDFPELTKFFRQTHDNTLKGTTVDPVALPHIFAAISYFSEIRNIVFILNLLNNTDRERFSNDNLLITNKMMLHFMNHGQSFHERRFNLNSKMGRHAFLQRLLRLGEALNPKNGSFFGLDKKIDVKALIALRNGICHQDQNAAHSIVVDLLDDKKTLEQITLELNKIMMHVIDMLKERALVYGEYDGNPENYWAQVLDAEKNRFAQSQEKESVLTPPARIVRRRVSEEAEKSVLETLDVIFRDHKETVIIENPDAFRLRFQNILNGTEEMPSQEEMGKKLLQPLSVLRKGQNADLYKTITLILSEAKKSNVTDEERAAIELQMQEEARRRQIERENAFPEMRAIRTLVRKFEAPALPENMLSSIKKITVAISSILDIKEFLEECRYLVPGSMFKTMNELDNHNKNNNRAGLLELLSKNPQLAYALEYNYGQVWQQVHSALGSCLEIHQWDDYHTFRETRNFVEHGNPFVEPVYDSINTSAELDIRYCVIAPKIIDTLFKLLPELDRLQAKLIGPRFTLTPPTPPVNGNPPIAGLLSSGFFKPAEQPLFLPVYPNKIL